VTTRTAFLSPASLLRRQELALYVDFKLDESYTPKNISIRAGNSVQDMKARRGAALFTCVRRSGRGVCTARLTLARAGGAHDRDAGAGGVGAPVVREADAASGGRTSAEVRTRLRLHLRRVLGAAPPRCPSSGTLRWLTCTLRVLRACSPSVCVWLWQRRATRHPRVPRPSGGADQPPERARHARAADQDLRPAQVRALLRACVWASAANAHARA
jgi:hypothetical protein